MTGVEKENALKLLFIEDIEVLSISDNVYHWLLLADPEFVEMAESRSFVDGNLDTVLLRIFFSFLSFLVSAPIVPNLFVPDTNTGPAKIAKLDDSEFVAIRDVLELVTPFCPLEVNIN